MQALKEGHTVHFLCLESDISPFSGFYDFNRSRDWSTAINELAETHNFAERHRENYTEERFKTPLEMVQRIADFDEETWVIVRDHTDYLKDAA